MTLDYWRKTGELKPFASVEEFEAFEQDLIENAAPKIKVNSPIHRSNVKRGIGSDGKKYDSLSEFIVFTYYEKINHIILTRNNKDKFYYYINQFNKQARYFPDFINPDIEVKGQMRPDDICKKSQVAGVTWYFQEDVNRMKKELDEKFGKQWRDGFIQTNVTL